jgi:hypothetical protein
MSFSIFVAVITPFVLAPLWTHELFKGSFERQKAIIALDNAAILIGREDRDLFNFLKNTNSIVEGLEKIHHPIHLALRMGALDPKLKLQDIGLETLIREMHSEAEVISNVRWSKSPMVASSEFRRMQVAGQIIQRANKVPVVEVKCSLCHLFVKWAPNLQLLKTHLEVISDGVAEKLSVSPTIGNTKINSSINYRCFLNTMKWG